MANSENKKSEFDVSTKIQDKFDLAFDSEKNEELPTIEIEKLEGAQSHPEESNTKAHQSAIVLDIAEDSNDLEFSNASDSNPISQPIDSGDSSNSIAISSGVEDLEFDLNFDGPSSASQQEKNNPEKVSAESASDELDHLFDLEIGESTAGQITSKNDVTAKTIKFQTDEHESVESSLRQVDPKENDSDTLEDFDLFDSNLSASPVAQKVEDSTLKTIVVDKSSANLSPNSHHANLSDLDETLNTIVDVGYQPDPAVGDFDFSSENFSSPINSIGQKGVGGVSEVLAKHQQESEITGGSDDINVENSQIKALKELGSHHKFETSINDIAPKMSIPSSYLNDEDSTRFQATIRQLREEREELLAQIKTLKNDSKELEQDNLTLKAALDESKIEISILRKRHMVELEDLKYRMAISEEKKNQAIEKAKLAELKKEKLEQRVRIDFNQVKQREKELETKLEMLSIDIDSQVQSRDQKILELRRKIDALEFNMENVSIRELKSQEDKRKLEEKLMKIMKTLRNSIKNLEDDVDHSYEDYKEENKIDNEKNKS